jgi:hypothetical protein
MANLRSKPTGRYGGAPSITPAQITEARGLLGWTVTKMAARAAISMTAASCAGRDSATRGEQTAARIQAALEAAGVEFITEKGGGGGVRLSKPN